MTFSPIRGAGTNNGYTNTAVAFPCSGRLPRRWLSAKLNARARQEARLPGAGPAG